MSGIKEPVRLRARELSNGNKSLYLDCYLNGRRTYEYLKLYLIPERTPLDKERNRTTLLQAESHKARRVIELQQGKYGVVQASKINRVMLSDYVLQTGQNRDISPRTVFGYGHTANLIKRYGDIRLQDITKHYCEGFISFLNGNIGMYNKPLKASTKADKIRKLNAAINRAMRNGLLSVNPIAQVEPSKKPHAQPTKRTYLTTTELEQLINTECKRGTVKRAFLFACFCGLRYSDICALCWRDIKTDANGRKQIEIRQQKTAQLLYLPLSDNAVKWLPDRPKGSKETDRVYNLMPKKETYRYNLKIWARAAGINKNIHFHVSRHTFATLLLTYGCDLYTVSKLLGHTNITTTQIYAKIVDKKKAAAVDMIPTL